MKPISYYINITINILLGMRAGLTQPAQPQ